MLRQVSVDPPPHDPALAAARVVENAVGLVRAEAKLVLIHARAVLVSTVGALLAVMLATSAAQVVLLLIAMSPVLFVGGSSFAVFLALMPALCLTALGACMAYAAWRGLRISSPVAARSED
jgi:hypothetical protein